MPSPDEIIEATLNNRDPLDDNLKRLLDLPQQEKKELLQSE